jgi:uncharacterized protein (DUF952 family)
VEPIFHIAEADAWDAARAAGEYRVSTRGRTLADVGFVHCGHRHQVERVANAAYRDAGSLVLLTIDPGRVGAKIKEETAGGVEFFPHIYGPIPTDAVVAVAPLEPAPGGLFVPPRSWLSPRLEVGPSPIEGSGLFATAPIETGEPAAVMGGTVLTDDEFARHIAGAGRWSAAAIDDDLNVLQDDDDPLTRGNHSCDPNLWMGDELTLVARRPIPPGQEATIDYALMTVDEAWCMECRCGTPECRGKVTGCDWRRADVQAAYLGYFSPFTERRIEAARSLGGSGPESASSTRTNAS